MSSQWTDQDLERWAKEGHPPLETNMINPYAGYSYPPPRADEARIMSRLNAIEAKLDAILRKLG